MWWSVHRLSQVHKYHLKLNCIYIYVCKCTSTYACINAFHSMSFKLEVHGSEYRIKWNGIQDKHMDTHTHTHKENHRILHLVIETLIQKS